MRRLGARLPRTPSPRQPGSAQHSPSPWVALHTSPATGLSRPMELALLQAVLPLAKRSTGKYCWRPRYRAITHGPFALHVAMSSSPLHHSRCWGAEPWMSRRHLDLGKGTSAWSSQGEGRARTWSLLDRGFPQAPMCQCYGIAKADKKSRRIAQRLHRGLKPP